MTGAVLLLLFGIGVVVGIISGLLGIGGGVLIVPSLYFIYQHPEWIGQPIPSELLVSVAHATSLFIIVPTAILGVLRYQQIGVVAWQAALPIGAMAIVSAIVGAQVAVVVPGRFLEIGFSLLLLGSAVQMLSGGRGIISSGERRITLPRTLVTGLLVGLLSALLGVGGGIIAIPLLSHLIGLEIEELAATSLAVVMFAAVAGTVTYMLSSSTAVGMPPGSIGRVHLLAALPILAGSLLSVRWGTYLNQRISTRALRLIFALLFGAIGIELLIENLPVLF